MEALFKMDHEVQWQLDPRKGLTIGVLSLNLSGKMANDKKVLKR